MTFLAIGTIAGHTELFPVCHRQGNPNPVHFHATVTIPLSFEDIVAALPELTTTPGDPSNIHALVLETVVSDNARMTKAACEIDSIRPGTDDARALAQLRTLATEVYLTPAQPAPGRESLRVGA